MNWAALTIVCLSLSACSATAQRTQEHVVIAPAPGEHDTIQEHHLNKQSDVSDKLDALQTDLNKLNKLSTGGPPGKP